MTIGDPDVVNNEKSAIFSLSLIMSFRMLGMFMLLPIFSLYALTVTGATPTLIGLALGIYGLTQACLQIPLGALSDRIGRKKVITAGLLLFALGSLVAAFAHTINGIIIGRAIQGAGAIGSTILAMAADLSRDENRSKAMAMIGLTIGLSFGVALVIGPLINHAFQLRGIFMATLILALIAILLLHTIVPNPPTFFHGSNLRYHNQQASAVLKNPQLMRLNLGIFSLHAILTATFIAAPLLLTHTIKLHLLQQTLLYLMVLGTAFLLMLPFIVIGEKKRQLKRFFIGAIGILALCETVLLTQPHSLIIIAPILVLFFAAFTFLEASLPSLVSKISPLKRKGTAMGCYSTSQFAGIFTGGSLGGILFEHFQFQGLFIFCLALALIWLAIAASMAEPRYLSTFMIKIETKSTQAIEKINDYLSNEAGVADFIIGKNEALIYVKADKQIIGKEQLRKAINACNLDE